MATSSDKLEHSEQYVHRHREGVLADPTEGTSVQLQYNQH